MKKKKKKNFLASAFIIGLSVVTISCSALAQQSGINRWELQWYDLSKRSARRIPMYQRAGQVFDEQQRELERHPGTQVLPDLSKIKPNVDVDESVARFEDYQNNQNVLGNLRALKPAVHVDESIARFNVQPNASSNSALTSNLKNYY